MGISEIDYRKFRKFVISASDCDRTMNKTWIYMFLGMENLIMTLFCISKVNVMV